MTGQTEHDAYREEGPWPEPIIPSASAVLDTAEQRAAKEKLPRPDDWLFFMPEPPVRIEAE
ncbi:MAG: hypothetical protein Q7R32_02765 [Dehalococcoidia bacterium]|nr:hypothetical protein [Dehalococcoidia bacterium]